MSLTTIEKSNLPVPLPMPYVAAALPETFLNLRLSPMRMLRCTPQEIKLDTEMLLQAAGALERCGVCCINMDYGTPDDNIFAMFEVVDGYRRAGG